MRGPVSYREMAVGVFSHRAEYRIEGNAFVYIDREVNVMQRSHSYGLAWLFAVAAVLGLLLSAAMGQSFTGAVNGVVKDPSGAVVPNAGLTLVNVNTNEARKQASNPDGRYVFPMLPPGSYRLEANVQGFQKFVRSNITVEVQQELSIDVELNVGAASQEVNVTGVTPLLQPSTSSLGQVVNNREIMELPLAGRNTLALIGLTAGAQPLGTFGGIVARLNSYTGGAFSTSGGMAFTNETLIDGVPGNCAVENTPAFIPTVDAVQEFKVETSNFSAEFGRTGGGVVNIVTKSGTNGLHGTLYEYFRNKALQANNWFSNRAGSPIPHDTFNQFGFTAGGPVVIPHLYNGRNRTFWFFNYEGLRERLGLSVLWSVPTPLQLQGNFTQTYYSPGNMVVIADPLSTQPNAASPGSYTRTPFPGNVIPANLIDPVAAGTRRYWPAPNTAGTATGANNFIGSGSAPNWQNQFTVRGDHSIGTKSKFFGRFAFSNVQRGGVDFFGNGMGWYNPGGGSVSHHFNARNVALDYTYVASPTLLFDIRYGFSRQFPHKTPALTGLDLTTVGFSTYYNQNIYFRAMPAITPSGVQALAAATSDLIRRGDNSHAVQGSVTKVLSRHTLKAGVDLRLILINELQPTAAQGQFSFTATFTGLNPLATTSSSGNSVASYLLGYPSSGSADYSPALRISSRYYAGYFQDDIKVSPKLTLNLGIRYEVETGRDEKYNRLSWFDPVVSNPLGAQVGIPGLRGGLEFAGVGGGPRRQVDTDLNPWGPRAGFAYRLTSKTIVRGGYAIFYLPNTGGLTGTSLGASGFFTTSTYVASLNGGLTPGNHLSNPFPNGFTQAPGSQPGLGSQIGQTLNTVIRYNRTSYAQEWNLNIQRELPLGILFDIAYVGNKGTGLPVNIQFNQLPDQYLSLGSQLLTQVANPFQNYALPGILSVSTISYAQLLVPYPEFGSVNVQALHLGSSIYHAMPLKVERRFSHGVSLLAAYTASKVLANANPQYSLNFSNPGYQNYHNLRAERSVASTDVPQRFVFSYNWELPFGPGRALLGSSHGVVGKVIGGWQVNGITTFQKGLPLGLTTSANNTNSNGGGSRPNNNGTSAALSGPVESRLNGYFNTSVFSQPPPFTFGNTGRELPDVRAPSSVNFDFSAFKNISLTERAKLQIRGEFFNFFNHPNFGAPGTTLGTSSFGVISSAANARDIQFGLKIIY